MANFAIPSPSNYLSSPMLQSPIEPSKTSNPLTNATKKQLKPQERRSLPKTQGTAKPKQSKSRNGTIREFRAYFIEPAVDGNKEGG